MHLGNKFWLGLVVYLTCAQLSNAQVPRFPLQKQTEIKIGNAAGESVARSKAEPVTAIAGIYSGMKQAPGHPLSCDARSNQDGFTEQRWKFDSRTAMFGNPAGGTLEMATRFLGCFEQTAKPDVRVGCNIGRCIQVPGTHYEICSDPPPFGPCADNCCAQDKKLLAEGPLHWSVMAEVNPFTNPAGFFALLPFAIDDGCNLDVDKNPNHGYHLNFWWPENEVEIQNYERTVFNPLYECRNDAGKDSFKHKNLTDFLRAHTATLTKFTPPDMSRSKVSQNEISAGLYVPGVREGLRLDPNIGESHWAGILPGDQTFVGEAHVYRTYVDTLGTLNYPGEKGTDLGYKRDCDCFYSSLQDQKVENKQRQTVNGWTEQQKYLQFWRYWQNSEPISQKRYEALKLYKDYNPDSCAFLRAWDDYVGRAPFAGMGYSDLYQILGYWPPFPPKTGDPIRLRKELERICYKGGGDLFPITGQLIGHFSPLPAAAYLARRALFLFGTKELILGNDIIDKEFIPKERRINRYSDKIDKMQRIYPLNGGGPIGFASQCYRGHDIPNTLQEGTDNWPKDLIGDVMSSQAFPGGPKDTPRFLHWNKRGSCMCPYLGPVLGVREIGTSNWMACKPNGKSCYKKDGDSDYDKEDSDTAKLEGSGGHSPNLPGIDVPIGNSILLADGIPFPFMPEFGSGAYTADPISGSDPAVDQIVNADGTIKRGACDLAKKPPNRPPGMHKSIPEELEKIQGGRNQGGVQCGKQDPRCSTTAGAPGSQPPDEPEVDKSCDALVGFEAQCRIQLDYIMSLTGDAKQKEIDKLGKSEGAAGVLYVGQIHNPRNDDEKIDTFLCGFPLAPGQARKQCSQLTLDGN